MINEEEIKVYTLENEMTAEFTNVGGRLLSLTVPLWLGEKRDIVLSLKELRKYRSDVIWEMTEKTESQITFRNDGHFITYSLGKDSLTVEADFSYEIYWNLKGHGVGNILDHRLILFSDETKEAYNFKKERPIAECIRMAEEELTKHRGYDHLYTLDHSRKMDFVLRDFTREVLLEGKTTAAQMRFETANTFTGKELGKGGCLYPRYGGVLFSPVGDEHRTVFTIRSSQNDYSI